MRTFEQFLTQKGFVSNEMLQAAMQAVQAWQPHSEQDLKSQRPPLTHFLVKLKAISLEKLVAAVDEYLSLSRSKLNESQANPEILPVRLYNPKNSLSPKNRNSERPPLIWQLITVKR